MRKLLVLSLLLVLGGCAALSKVENAFNTLSGATVSPAAVVVAVNSFDALEATATNYLRLKKCSPATGPVCRDPAATKVLIPAVRNARKARNDLESFLADHPGQLGTQGLYDALQLSINTIQGIIVTYHIGAPQ